MANLQAAIGLWILAALLVFSAYGAIFGLAIGLIALWPFGQFLRPRVSNPVLALVLLAAGVLFVALSVLYLQWLVSAGFQG